MKIEQVKLLIESIDVGNILEMMMTTVQMIGEKGGADENDNCVVQMHLHMIIIEIVQMVIMTIVEMVMMIIQMMMMMMMTVMKMTIVQTIMMMMTTV